MTGPESSTNEQGHVPDAAIEDLLPHRHPFLLVDRVLSHEQERAIRCSYRVPVDHPYLNRLSGFSCFPPCLLIEALGQTAALSIRLTRPVAASGAAQLGFLVRIDQCSLSAPAQASDEVVLSARLVASYGPLHKYDVNAQIDGRTVATASLTLHVDA